MKLFDNEANDIGYITSGTFSPTIRSSIAIGYITRKCNTNEKIYTIIRGKREELEILKLPFLIHNYKKG